MALSISDVDNRIGGTVGLTLGKTWNSFEQFRTDGVVGIRSAIKEGTIGTVRVGDTEFVLLRRVDFNRLYGFAVEVKRLTRGVLLLRRAAELVMKSPEKDQSLKLLHELTMEFTVPTAAAPWHGELEIQATEQVTSALDPETHQPPRAALRQEKAGEGAE
jgi:hypothetical protein